jgi:AhpC/TSA family
MESLRPAPDWQISQWLNTKVPLSLQALRGKPVIALAFQMLCPGCVSTSLPQVQRVREAFAPEDLAVIGLHTVFEHHPVQGTAQALSAFLHEYRITVPVGIDAPSGNGPPQTMQGYQMRGTPTTLLFDREGRLRLQAFGHVDDLRLGAAIQALIGDAALTQPPARPAGAATCDDHGCAV